MKNMLSRMFAVVAIGFFAATAAGVACAADKEEAVALVEKAADMFKSAGKDKTLAAISDPKGPFVNGALYVFAYDMSGVIVAHPMNPKLVGKNMLEVKDADGKAFSKDFVATAKSASGKGWVDYRWTNPVSKKIEAKSSYVQRVSDNYFLGCGIYK